MTSESNWEYNIIRKETVYPSFFRNLLVHQLPERNKRSNKKEREKSVWIRNRTIEIK